MKRVVVAVVSLVLLGATGCGGDSGDSNGSGSDEEQIQALADTYSQAALDGDAAAACETFSREAIEAVENTEEFDSCEEIVEYGFGILDDAQKEEIAKISDIQVDGDTATAEGRDGTIDFIKEDGEWKLQPDDGS